MNRWRLGTPVVVALLTIWLLLGACGGGQSASDGANTASAPAAPAMPAASEAERAPEAAASGGSAAAPNQQEAPAASSAPGAPLPTALPDTVGISGDAGRKVIKNATMTISVTSVPSALSQISTAAATLGGYVLETRTDYSDQQAREATLSMAVPSTQFEALLQRVRDSSDQVLSEEATGSDVTQEFVDVQSQIANLEATQARVRAFLDQATSVEESLRVNAQLSELEGQISQLKGRIQYLSQRSAFSTVTVELRSYPSAVALAEPDPQTVPWNPSKTAAQAYATLALIGQGVGTLLIWLLIVGVPLMLPVLLAAWAVRAMRRGNKRVS